MARRGTRRLLAVLAAPIAALLFGVFALSGTASAHTVTGIEANCSTVTVHFANFPDTDVTVHIEATVEGHGSVGADVVVNSQTSIGTLNISGVTAALFGTTASVDVDVTWNLDGAQDVHGSFTLTCGMTTTTTGATSTTIEHETSTTGEHETSTTEAPSTTLFGVTSSTGESQSTTTQPTSTSVLGVTSTSEEGASSTSVPVGVTFGGSSPGSNGGSGGNGGETGATAVLGASAELNSPGATVALSASELEGTATGSTGSLPFTGSSLMPLLGIGTAALAVGALAAGVTGRRRSPIRRHI